VTAKRKEEIREKRDGVDYLKDGKKEGPMKRKGDHGAFLRLAVGDNKGGEGGGGKQVEGVVRLRGVGEKQLKEVKF